VKLTSSGAGPPACGLSESGPTRGLAIATRLCTVKRLRPAVRIVSEILRVSPAGISPKSRAVA